MREVGETRAFSRARMRGENMWGPGYPKESIPLESIVRLQQKGQISVLQLLQTLNN